MKKLEGFELFMITLTICGTVIIIAAMLTGNMDKLPF